jgi:hypothetical protein
VESVPIPEPKFVRDNIQINVEICFTKGYRRLPTKEIFGLEYKRQDELQGH